MDLLVTLRDTKHIDKITPLCDGYIVGSLFSSGYNYSLDAIKRINQYCKENKKQIYIVMDNFINEEEKTKLFNYMEFIKALNVNGIYFHDLGVYDVAKKYGMESKLIYDGQTIICNSLDIAFYQTQGIRGFVLSRELTLSEISKIILQNQNICDLLIFGHARMSYSKRKFLTNYFKEINMQYDFFNKNSLRLVEEKRNFKMPIVEDSSGTKIYTDYVFQMYNEISALKQYVRRGIIDTMFINDGREINVLRDMRRIKSENSNFLLESLKKEYPDSYSTGYLYQKTNITKDE